MSYRGKCIILGDPAVGKTSLLNRFVDDKFPEGYLPTVGANFLVTEVNLTNIIDKLIKLDDDLRDKVKKKGLKIMFVPETIVEHPIESSGVILDRNGLKAKGAVYSELFGISSYFISILFILKRAKIIKNHLSLKAAIRIMINSIINYNKLKRCSLWKSY